MQNRTALAAALVVGVSAFAAGCGGSSTSSTDASAPAASTEASAPTGSTDAGAASTPAASTAASNQKRLTIGFVAHAQGDPFIKSIIAAAQQAAKDSNVELKTAGTPAIDANAELQRVNDVVAAGADGVATSVPGDSEANGLNALIAKGKPIVQWNIASARVKAPYVGEASVAAWKILGDKILAKIGGPSATGKVVIGTCAPGLGVLEARIKGVRQGLAPAKGLTFVGPLNIPVDAVGNQNAWTQAVAANKDAKVLIGVCAPDLASLGKVNAANGDRYVAGGSDLTTQNLNAIKEGHAFITVGQTGFVQGYLPVLMLAQALRNHTLLPEGKMVPAGVQVVTKDSIVMPWGLPTVSFDKLQELENDPAAAAAYYKPLFAPGGKLADWASQLIPLANALP